MDKNDTYAFDMKDGVLEFRTTSFRAEKGSVLHSGIYNRETASMLAAGACLAIPGFFFASVLKLTVIHSAGVLLLFVATFLFFRTFVFPEAVLRVTMDRGDKMVTILSRGAVRSRKLQFPLSELEGIREDYMEIVPENPDGVRVVKNIALQHGTVIPGFGEAAVLYTVVLDFRNEAGLAVFSSSDYAAAGDVTERFKNYIER